MDFKSTLGDLTQGAGGMAPEITGMGGGLRPGNFRGGPVRIKKTHTLAGTIGGVLFGIVMIFGSPVAMWMAESQHTAKDFASAQKVESTTAVDGYVTFQGAPALTKGVLCIQANCLYAELRNQDLVTKQGEECGTIQTNEKIRILRETVLECDEDGNCKQCYMVERDVWEDKSVTENYGTAMVGAYTVQLGSDAVMLGLEEKILDKSAKMREVWKYLTVPTELRVAGDSIGGSVVGAGEKTFVVSQYDYAKTLKELQSRDASNRIMLLVGGFALLFFGFMALFGPIEYFSFLLRRFPLVGPLIKEGTKLLIVVVSFLLAVVCFLVLWGLVLIVKNVVVLIAVMVLGLLGLVLWAKKAKAEPKGQAKA